MTVTWTILWTFATTFVTWAILHFLLFWAFVWLWKLYCILLKIFYAPMSSKILQNCLIVFLKNSWIPRNIQGAFADKIFHIWNYGLPFQIVDESMPQNFQLLEEDPPPEPRLRGRSPQYCRNVFSKTVNFAQNCPKYYFFLGNTNFIRIQFFSNFSSFPFYHYITIKRHDIPKIVHLQPQFGRDIMGLIPPPIFSPSSVSVPLPHLPNRWGRANQNCFSEP